MLQLDEESAAPDVGGQESMTLKTMMPTDLHPATKALVFGFACALADKLFAAQEKYGYSDGWRNADWMGECRQHLREHIEKGDPRDVAAYCAFLWHHNQSTAPAAPAPEATPAEGGLIERLRRRIDPVEHHTDRSDNLKVVCPKCDEEFTVKCEY